MFRTAGATVIVLALTLAGCDSAEERKLAHVEEGRALTAQGAFDNATVAYLNALKIDANYAPAHLGLGEALRKKGDMGRAAAHLRAAVEHQPDVLASRLDLAEVAMGLGEIEEAERNADAALALSPDAPRALAVKAAVLMAKESPEEAAAMARRALAADPSLTFARLTLIADRIRAGDMTEALAELDAAEAEEAAPAALLAVIRLAVLDRVGDREGQGAALRRLLELTGEAAVRLSLVRWHLRGDPPEVEAAEALLRETADADGATQTQIFQLIELIAATRGPDAARAELVTRAEREGPGGQVDLALAIFDAQRGDLEAAKARAEVAITTAASPDRADAGRLLLARLLDPLTEADRRTGLIEAVLARDANNVEALTLRGETRIRQDRYAEAIADLRAALAGAPQSANILELMAIAHERDGAPELARERRALAAHVSDYAPGPTLRYAGRLIREGDPETAETIISDALARAPENRNLLAALAEARLVRGDIAGARGVAAQIAGLGDDGGLSARIEGAALMEMGQTAAATALLSEVWEDSGVKADLETLVRLHMRLDEPEKAAALIESALADAPGDIRSWLLLADVRLVTGGPIAAAAALRDGIAAVPNDAPLHAALARALSAGGDDAGAASATQAGLAIDPGNAALRFENARHLEAVGDFDAAIAAYEALYAENPGNMIVANNLASLLAENRDDAASLERAAAVAKRLRGSGVPAFLDTYGWTLHRIGNQSEALATLRQSTAALDAEPLAHHHLAMALKAAGETGEAETHFERALALAGDGGVLPPRARREAEDALRNLRTPSQ